MVQVYFVMSDGLGKPNGLPIYRYTRLSEPPAGEIDDLVRAIGRISERLMHLHKLYCCILSETEYRDMCKTMPDLATANIEEIKL